MSDAAEFPDRADEDELVLSPSETLAHNTAMRVSGAAQGGAARTQRALASIVLGFELIIVFLIGMTAYGLDVLEPRELGIWIGVGLCALILAALATMRFGNVGTSLGWVVHALMLLTAIIVPLALIVGIIFTGLWIYCFVKGRQIDRDRELWLASQR